LRAAPELTNPDAIEIPLDQIAAFVFVAECSAAISSFVD
jgi:hypothetical protein